jgi:cell division ATPase FtsA
LDKTKQEKIPLNIFGDHLSLHMTFLSLPKNNLKNINALFDNSDLKVNRIISKPLVSGLDLLNKNKDLKNFAIIHFDSELSSVSLYEDSSLTFLKTFPFGTNSIYRDIAQLCSLKKDEIRLIFNELNFNNLQKERVKYLDKKFFIKSDFMKLSVNHLKSIIDARIEEMINYIFNKNKNLNCLDNKVPLIYVFFEDKCVFNNLGNLFKNSLNIEQSKILSKFFPLDDFSALLGAAELILKGWHKEAIPFTNEKKSVISGFFSRFF